MVADILSQRDFTDATQVSMMVAPHINYDIMDIGFPHWFAGGIDGIIFVPPLLEDLGEFGERMTTWWMTWMFHSCCMGESSILAL